MDLRRIGVYCDTFDRCNQGFGPKNSRESHVKQVITQDGIVRDSIEIRKRKIAKCYLRGINLELFDIVLNVLKAN